MYGMRTDLDDNKDVIIEALQKGTPRAVLCRLFKCKYDTLKARLDSWGIKLTNQHRKGLPHPEAYKPASEYLHKDSKIQSHKLKEKLIRDGIKEAKCEICKNHMWMNKPIPLELDHINGDHFDNRLENLQILCPTCHAQQPTNSGKNKGKYADVS